MMACRHTSIGRRPALIMLLALILAACGSAPSTPGQAGTISGEAILIGVSGPLTGPNAQYGAQWKTGFDLALRPRLLLLDEPTAGMNPTETAEMLEIIRQLKAPSLSIVLIEHKLDLVMELSDRVVVMDDGRKIADGLPAAVRSDPAVVEAYLGHRGVGSVGSKSH